MLLYFTTQMSMDNGITFELLQGEGLLLTPAFLPSRLVSRSLLLFLWIPAHSSCDLRTHSKGSALHLKVPSKNFPISKKGQKSFFLCYFLMCAL